MILQARYLFMLYYFNLFLLKESLAPKDGLFSKKGKGKMKKSGKGFLINMVTTSFIIDDTSQRFENYRSSHENKFSKFTNFMIDLIGTELSLHGETEYQNTMKLMYVAYIATEYYYSLTLCTIWGHVDSVLDNQIPFLQKLKEDNILKNCENALLIFRDITKSYAEVLNVLGLAVSQTYEILEIKRLISVCAEIISITYEDLKVMINHEHFLYGSFPRDVLYKKLGNDAICLNTIRKYFNFSIAVTSIMDFRANIIRESQVDQTPFITKEEQFFWRNVVNIIDTYDSAKQNMHPLQILSKCEEFRNELAFYTAGEIPCIYPVHIQRDYLYPNFKISFNSDQASFILNKN